MLDRTHVVLFAPNDKRAYLMQLAAPISDLKFAFKVAFIDRDRDGQLALRCRVTYVRTLYQSTQAYEATALDFPGFAGQLIINALRQLRMRRG